MSRIAAAVLAFISLSALGADKMAFWKAVPRGANMSTENPEADFAAAVTYGIRLVRFGADDDPHV
jgi:hypothetical protein